jgi:hypothetical protein
MKNDKQQPEKGTAIKKRIEVQFIKLEATQKSISNMYEFIYGVAPSIKTSMDRLKWDDYCDDIIRQGYYKLKTMESGEGTQNAKFGCYILKGIDGECWPVKPDIFERTYDVQSPNTFTLQPANNDYAVKESQWISVGDRLPEHGEDFNVVLDLQDGGDPVSGIMEFDGVNRIWLYPGSDVECTQVTHWQPLPSPPNN